MLHPRIDDNYSWRKQESWGVSERIAGDVLQLYEESDRVGHYCIGASNNAQQLSLGTAVERNCTLMHC